MSQLIDKILKLRELAIEEHYIDKGEGLYNCSSVDNTNWECDCGVDGHNKRVEEVYKDIWLDLWSKDSQKYGEEY